MKKLTFENRNRFFHQAELQEGDFFVCTSNMEELNDFRVKELAKQMGYEVYKYCADEEGDVYKVIK